jgi:hypothetical protein
MAEVTMKEAAYLRAESTGKPVEITHPHTCGPRNSRLVCDECFAKVVEFFAIYDREEALKNAVRGQD